MDAFDPSLVFVCRVDDVPEGQIRRFDAGENAAIAVANVQGTLFAFDDRCTHGAASLSEDGQLIGHVVECGWHCGQFDVRTGEAVAAPCTEDLRSFALVLEDRLVFVKKCELAAASN
jgi:p-cumate 2,3-dioxygenase ferredoxin component